MRRAEEQFNTVEQVREYLAAALAIVDELGPPDDLRVSVFAKAADLIAGKQVFFEQAQQIPLDPLLASRLRGH